MDDRSESESERTAARIAAPLREGERLSAGFEDRVLSRVRAEQLEAARRKTKHPRGWLTTPRITTRTPVLSMALAAGFAAFIALATLTFVRAGGPEINLVSAPDTVHVVRFVYVDSTARQISVVGDFNGWGAGETPLAVSESNGVWTASVVLPAGAHEYAFVIDGKRWVADPYALSSRDEFGTPTSVVHFDSAELDAE